MKFRLFFFILSLSSVSLFAGDPVKNAKTSNQKPTKPISQKEIEDNVNRLVSDKLDPNVILKETIPEFVNLQEVEPLDSDFETIGEKYSVKKQNLNVPGFLYKEKPKPLGTVLGGLSGEEMLGPSQRVLIDTKQTLKPGNLYSVLHFVKQVHDFSNKKVIWQYYNYAGDIEIIEVESGKKMIGISQEYAIVKTGDLLIPKIKTLRVLDAKKGQRKKFKDKAIITTLSDNDANVIGDGGFVFLNKGSQNGLSINQILDVYLDPTLHKMKGKSSQPIASVQVLDLTNESATAYILNCNQEITVGDFASSF
jgi:hypothetical protein